MSNIPNNNIENQQLKQLFNGAFYQNITVNDSTYNLIYGFFLDRTNSKDAADALTSSLITLGYNNKINPVDLLKEFDKTTSESDFKKLLLSIFNSGRLSTSKLGYTRAGNTNQWTDRTILP